MEKNNEALGPQKKKAGIGIQPGIIAL